VSSSRELSDPQPQSFRLTAIVVGAFLALALISGSVYWVGQRDPVLPKEGVTLSATVKFVALEGGCWMLDTKHGVFLVSGLPKEFKVNGLKVTARVQLATSQAHYCPKGRGIVVVSSVARSSA
jgi:hypothetical protein